MTLPTGQLSFSQVNTELGKAVTTSISLNDTAVRTLAGVPSGQISFSHLLGKSAQVTGGNLVAGVTNSFADYYGYNSGGGNQNGFYFLPAYGSINPANIPLGTGGHVIKGIHTFDNYGFYALQISFTGTTNAVGLAGKSFRVKNSSGTVLGTWAFSAAIYEAYGSSINNQYTWNVGSFTFAAGASYYVEIV